MPLSFGKVGEEEEKRIEEKQRREMPLARGKVKRKKCQREARDRTEQGQESQETLCPFLPISPAVGALDPILQIRKLSCGMKRLAHSHAVCN